MRSAAVALVAGLGCLATAGLARARPLAGEEQKAPAQPGAGKAALVGRWKLNAALSEDPREKLQQAREQSSRGGGMGVPGGGHGGGWGDRGGGAGWGGHGHGAGGPGGGYGSGAGQGSAPGTMTLLSATELTITNIEPEISIVEPEGMVRYLHPDNKKYDTSNGGEVKAAWKGDQLEVETKGERSKVGETWSVSPETRQLTVELRLQFGGMAPVSVKRVYDPVKTDADQP
jgi:hypothetical protein